MGVAHLLDAAGEDIKDAVRIRTAIKVKFPSVKYITVFQDISQGN
jgi:hypothetical protein